MRRFSTLSALAAGALALLLGVYIAQVPHTGGIPSGAQAAFSPNSLATDVNLKTESWQAF